MSHRFTRAARNRAKPGGTWYDHEALRHHGDEFDELVRDDGVLTTVPVRDYTPHVPQVFDDLNDQSEEAHSILNQMGPLIAGAEPVVTDVKAFSSYLAAFDKRSNAQPDDDDDCSPDFQAKALKLWDDFARDKNISDWDVDEAAIDRWLAKMDGSKKIRMLAALDSMFECELDSSYLGEKKLSVKLEALLKRYDRKWAPRLIYEGNDHFNALTGPYAMIICEMLNDLFTSSPLGNLDVRLAYKRNDVELAAHLSEADLAGCSEVAEGDFSANDLNQRRFVTTLFDKVCEVLHVHPLIRKLFRDNRVFTVKNLAHGHRAKLANQLPTGTTLTTPRNSVWNATIQAIYCNVTGNRGSAVILGDDYLACLLNPTNPVHWGSWVATETKMKLKGLSPALSGEATFLSRRFVINTETPCMFPKLGKALARFNVRVTRNMAISDESYMAGKALSYAYEFRHMPCIRDLFLMRFKAEGGAAVVVESEVSWYLRTSGVDVHNLETAILEERVVLSEDVTREVLMDAYGDEFGLTDCLEFCRRIILCTDSEIVAPLAGLEIDW